MPTFPDYINNPSGRSGGLWSHRDIYKQLYTQKLDMIMVREAGKINYKTYYIEKENRYFIYFKIPSEVVPKFYYDTVIEFYPGDNFTANNNFLKKYNVRFYSNDPAFVYTHAYSFLKNRIFIKELVPRMSKEAVTKAAKETNPNNEIGYVKSIYFAYLLMDRYKLWNAQDIRNFGEKFNLKNILSLIEHADKKVQARKDAEEEINKKKAIDTKKEKRAEKNNERRNNYKNNTKQTKPISNIKNIKNTKNVKQTTFTPNFKK